MTLSLRLKENEIHDLIWIQTSFLGDIIINTAAINLIATKYPNIRQHIITTKIGKAALSCLSFVSSIIVLNKGEGKILDSFKDVKNQINIPSRKNAAILQPHRSYRSTLLAKYLRIPNITYRQTDGSILASVTVERVSVFHEASRIALLLEPLGVSREDIRDVMPYLPPASFSSSVGWQKELQDFSGHLVAIAPGSVWGTKRWKTEKFLDLAESLLRLDGVGLVLLGSSKEREQTEFIQNNLVGFEDRLWNLAGETSLDDLRRIYPNLRLLVSNDSSPIHYGSAFQVPTIALFGATVPAMGFSPLAKGSVSLG